MLMHLKKPKSSKSKSRGTDQPQSAGDTAGSAEAEVSTTVPPPGPPLPAPAPAPAPVVMAAGMAVAPAVPIPNMSMGAAAVPGNPVMNKPAALTIDDMEARMAGIEAAYASRKESPAAGSAPAVSSAAILHAQLSGLSSGSNHRGNVSFGVMQDGGAPQSVQSSTRLAPFLLLRNSTSTASMPDGMAQRRVESQPSDLGGSSGSSAQQPGGAGARQFPYSAGATRRPQPPVTDLPDLPSMQRLAQMMYSGSGEKHIASSPSSTGAHPPPAKRSTPTPAELLRNVEASAGGKKLSKALDVLILKKRDAGFSGSGSSGPSDICQLPQAFGPPAGASSCAFVSSSSTYDHAAAIVESLEASMSRSVAFEPPGEATSSVGQLRAGGGSLPATFAQHTSCTALVNDAMVNPAGSPSHTQGLNQLLRTLEQTTGGRRLNRALDVLFAAKHSVRRAP
jgi:hypothetical protein